MRQYETPLWGRLGGVEAAQLERVRSRRNRRALYRYWLEDALLVQSLYAADKATGPAAHSLEPAVTKEVLEWLYATAPKVAFGVPTRQLVPYGPDALEIILLDLRGHAPPRALAALSKAATDMSSAPGVVGMAIVHGASGQTDMLQLTIRRWIQEYGRGKVLRAAPASNGTIVALDSRRLAQFSTVEEPTIPLDTEVQTLRELYALTGGNPDRVRVPTPDGYFGSGGGDGDDRPKKKRRRRGRGGRGRK